MAGQKWSPQQKAKYIATMAAKRQKKHAARGHEAEVGKSVSVHRGSLLKKVEEMGLEDQLYAEIGRTVVRFLKQHAQH